MLNPQTTSSVLNQRYNVASYADAKPFVGGLAQLMTDDGRWGMIDTAGNIVLPFTYDSISQNSSGVIACYREETGWSVLRVMQ